MVTARPGGIAHDRPWVETQPLETAALGGYHRLLTPPTDGPGETVLASPVDQPGPTRVPARRARLLAGRGRVNDIADPSGAPSRSLLIPVLGLFKCPLARWWG